MYGAHFFGVGTIGEAIMGNYPQILDTLERLRLYKSQKVYSNTQLAADMTDFGWTWSESYVASLMAGRKKLDEHKKLFVNKYLLDRYSQETLT